MADEPLALRLSDLLSMHNVLTAKTFGRHAGFLRSQPRLCVLLHRCKLLCESYRLHKAPTGGLPNGCGKWLKSCSNIEGNPLKFKAAVLSEFRVPLKIETLGLTQLADTDVLVRVRATSLCHTDLEGVEGNLGVPLPIVPGHEAAGVVEWIGRSVTRVQIGDHVVMSWNPHCGECFYARVINESCASHIEQMPRSRITLTAVIV